MTSRSRVLCAIYALIALAALYGTWSQNLLYSGAPAGIGATFLQDLRANPASRSISIDISWVLLAASILMVTEARRIGLRFVWAYILGGFLIAISMTFPLFLLAREVRMASGKPVAPAPRWIATLDTIGLVIIAGIVIYLAVWLH